MTEKQDRDRSQKLVESVAIDLRVVLNDARQALDEFETYVESWDDQVDAMREDAATHDPRAMTEGYVVLRALEMLEDVAHIHSGSTRASNWRRARTRLVQLAKAAPAF